MLFDGQTRKKRVNCLCGENGNSGDSQRLPFVGNGFVVESAKVV